MNDRVNKRGNFEVAPFEGELVKPLVPGQAYLALGPVPWRGSPCYDLGPVLHV